VPNSFPHLDLGTYPSEVRLLSAEQQGLWVKDDSAIHPLYGGNKLRKLNFIFADAVARKATLVKTIGAAGSHHVLATALHGRALGLQVKAVLVPQHRTPHAERNLARALQAGLIAVPQPSQALGMIKYWRESGYSIPLGGSSLIGAMGYVHAATELAEDIRAGRAPMPDAIVVALGSGGTVAGLLAGLGAEFGRTTLYGVAIAKPAFASGLLARNLARKLSAKLKSKPSVQLQIVSSFVGAGYGLPSAAGKAALAEANALGLALEPTYTAKAFAFAQTLQRAGKRVLYWHTLSGGQVETASERAEARKSELPAFLWT
jgi:1-aminocyclopropane-1-carboxylate deaminase/D-cysteine desulfhydrase-like pyridoxal-dependent ACC family enzyme